MASFAKLGANGEVLEVVAVDNSVITDSNGIEKEKLGIDFLTEVYNWPVWKQTSYNTQGGQHKDGGTPLRGNYAGIGMIYDDDNDLFLAKKPYASWVLNTSEARWQSPVGDAPELSEEEALTLRYEWNESTGAWDKVAR